MAIHGVHDLDLVAAGGADVVVERHLILYPSG
jgi:hypothetical protein